MATAVTRQRVEIETRVHALVAEHLGVDVCDLAEDVSLVDDLAADSLDLVEIAVAIEEALGVVLPHAFLDEVRTCGELVHRTLVEIGRRRAGRRGPVAAVTSLRARIVAAGATPAWYLERTLALDPYAVETIADDVRHAGDGARVELTVGDGVDASALTWLALRFAPLRARGIDVDIRRGAAPRRWSPRVKHAS